MADPGRDAFGFVPLSRHAFRDPVANLSLDGRSGKDARALLRRRGRHADWRPSRPTVGLRGFRGWRALLRVRRDRGVQEAAGDRGVDADVDERPLAQGVRNQE